MAVSRSRTITIGSRGSQLAMLQSNLVRAALSKIAPEAHFEIIKIVTSGDLKQGQPESVVRDKKDWILEIEQGIVRGEIDLAVHSGKDVPVDVDSSTELVPILKRESPYDVLVSKYKLEELPHGSMVGTASLRRGAQLLRFRPDLSLVKTRGNVPTRLAKLESDSGLAALVLAEAGLKRLGFQDLSLECLLPPHFVPAVNQGQLVAQVKQGNTEMLTLVGQLCGLTELSCWRAERAVISRLEADCSSAVGALARIDGADLEITAVVLTRDGKRSIESSRVGQPQQAQELGLSVAEELLKGGARAILDS